MIEFYLKNFKKPNNKNHVREMIRVFDAENKVILDTISDEAAQKAHPVEYKEFRALFEANQDEMRQAAIAESEKEG